MDEAGDDFLAGAGLTGHEHGRVRLRDLGRLLQHVAPFRGLAHDADPRLGFELVREQLHPRFEPLGAGLRLGGLCSASTSCSCETDSAMYSAIRRAAEIVRRERPRQLRPEGQVDDLLTGRDPYAEEGAISGRDDRRERVRGVKDRQCLGADVGDDEFIGPVGPGRDRQDWGSWEATRPGARNDDPIDEDHGQRVVRQHPVGNLRDLRKHRADVEDVRDGPEQLDGGFDLGRPLAIDGPLTSLLGKPLVRQAGEERGGCGVEGGGGGGYCEASGVSGGGVGQRSRGRCCFSADGRLRCLKRSPTSCFSESAASRSSTKANCWLASADGSTPDAICASACGALQPRTERRHTHSASIPPGACGAALSPSRVLARCTLTRTPRGSGRIQAAATGDFSDFGQIFAGRAAAAGLLLP